MALHNGVLDGDDDESYEQRLAALHRWRTEAVTAGNTGPGRLRDSELMVIARSDAVAADDVRGHLPVKQRALAEDMATALAAVDGDAPDEQPNRDQGPVTGAEPEFAPPEPGPHVVPERLVTVRTTGSGLALSWPAVAGDPVAGEQAVVVYRVMSKDRTASWAPESAGTVPVAVTEECHARDDRPFTHARRYVDVWAYVGASREEAVRTAPVRHAHGLVIAPVTDVALSQSEDRVVGQWTVPRGTVAVDVLRIPMEEVPAGCGDPRYRVRSDEANLEGVDDVGVQRGHSFLYEIRTVAPDDADNLRYSDPVQVEMAVAAELRPVGDLTAELVGTDEVDLRWSRPPAGRVHLYRIAEEPAAGAGREPIRFDDRALQEVRLPPHTRLLHPVRDDGPGRAVMARVPWPSGWTRAFFVPVTELDGRAHVGTPWRVVRTGQVTNPRIVERVHREVLTFGWPAGADVVWLYQGVAGQPASSAVTGQPVRTVMREQYRNEGGMHLDPPLPALGCSVHLVPVVWDGGRPELGTATSLDYPGLLRMQYRITARRNLVGRLTAFTVWLRSDIELAAPPPFVLVYRPDRMPLEIGDGQPVPVTAAWDAGAAPVVRIAPPPMHAGDNPDLGWTADARRWSGGYLRLFPDVDDARRAVVALQDPPLAELCLLPPGRALGAR